MEHLGIISLLVHISIMVLTKSQLSVVSLILMVCQNSGIMGNVLNLVFVRPMRILSLKVRYDVMTFNTSFGMSLNVA